MKEMILHNAPEKIAGITLWGIIDIRAVAFISAGYLLGHIVTYIRMKNRYDTKK